MEGDVHMKKSNGAQWWNEDKSFYMILMLCLMAIAVAAYVLFALPTSSAVSYTHLTLPTKA